MLMETSIKVNGIWIKLKDLVHIHIKMGQNIKEIGNMISNKDMEYKFGRMVLDIKDNIN